MTALHQEVHFEREVVDHLGAHGWLVSPNDVGYDRERALFPEDLFAFLQETQPEEWSKIAGTEAQFLARVCKLLDEQGTLAVLRQPVKDRNAKFDLCQFKPAHGLNAETAARYKVVRLRVMQQVRYSLHHEGRIDLVFFVNGLPVATAELKTDFTQTVFHAITQYRKDRPPKDPTTKKLEPLLAFKRRALVHFATSTDEVYMATHLKGEETEFLPFNRGHEGAAGNPPNPEGYRTCYLWETILQRDAWLEILGQFVHLQKTERTDAAGNTTSKESLIFPRYHQWEAVTELVGASRAEGPGRTYLVQHSAGSGKTNSIGWLSHQLSVLHDVDDAKVFDSIVVVTDRTVLDSQLQDAIYQFQHKHGVVAGITNKAGAKTGQLAEALKNKTPIIIVTLQTFPHLLDHIRGQAALKDRAFAVIVDEAHSSMSGAAARKLRAVLLLAGGGDDQEITAEDLMNAEMEARKFPPHVSFFAFTATPKAKTIELFGRRPDPSQPPSDTNLPQPFHVYSMQQAIEEGFILDVLKNFTSYRVAYKIAHNGREYDDHEIDQSEGMKQLARWVRLHPHNVAQKVAIIVEHFRQHVAWRLGGQAKAMVVTASRKEAVRYKLALDAYLRDKQYADIAALVAFSGDVVDPESGPDPFNEFTMNPDLTGRDIRKAFDTDGFNILLVANKFQTGFDQPKLVAMYVDKKLAGVATVQTLSRLNRTFPGKTDTFILDFVNEPEAVRADFEPFYRTAALSDVSDPNLIHDLQSKLDATGIYLPSEVDAFALAVFDPKGTQQRLQALIAPAVDRYRGRMADAVAVKDDTEVEALRMILRDMGTFVRAYDFLSQIVDFSDVDLEKRYAFFKALVQWLRTENQREVIDLSSLVLTHHRVRKTADATIQLGADEDDHRLKPLSGLGTGVTRTPQTTTLAQLVARLNDLFEGDLSDADLVAYVQHIAGRMLENETLAQQAAQNNKQQFGLGDFQRVLTDTVIEGLGRYESMASQVMGNDALKQEFAKLLLDVVYEGFKTRNEPSGHSVE